MFKLNDLDSRRFAWRLGAVLLVVVTVGTVNAAWSIGQLAQGQILAAKARIGEARVRPVPIREGFRMRCWQHGRLLFEESIAEVPAAFAGQAMALPSGESASGTVYLLNTPTGLCLVKPTDAPARGIAVMPQS